MPRGRRVRRIPARSAGGLRRRRGERAGGVGLARAPQDGRRLPPPALPGGADPARLPALRLAGLALGVIGALLFGGAGQAVALWYWTVATLGAAALALLFLETPREEPPLRGPRQELALLGAGAGRVALRAGGAPSGRRRRLLRESRRRRRRRAATSRCWQPIRCTASPGCRSTSRSIACTDSSCGTERSRT